MNEQIVKTQRARIEYLESICKEFEMMQDIAADKYFEQKNELAALRAERDELRTALDKTSEIVMRLLGKLPYGDNPYAAGYVENYISFARAILAKYEVTK